LPLPNEKLKMADFAFRIRLSMAKDAWKQACKAGKVTSEDALNPAYKDGFVVGSIAAHHFLAGYKPKQLTQLLLSQLPATPWTVLRGMYEEIWARSYQMGWGASRRDDPVFKEAFFCGMENTFGTVRLIEKIQKRAEKPGMASSSRNAHVKKILTAVLAALILAVLWLIQDNFRFVQSRPKHFSISDIEALGLGFKFAKEPTTADGKTRIWTFDWDVPGPLPVQVQIHANPTKDELMAAAAAVFHEAMYLDDKQAQDNAENATPTPTPLITLNQTPSATPEAGPSSPSANKESKRTQQLTKKHRGDQLSR
jgi:hypothetical protein